MALPNWIIPITFFIGVVAVAGILVYILIIATKTKKIESNEDMGFNIADLKSGHLTGKVLDMRLMPSGATKVTMLPNDINPKTMEKMKNKIKPFDFLAGTVATIPKNKGSRDKNHHIFFPQDPEKIPEDIKDTSFGKILSYGLEFYNANETILTAMREGINRMKMYLNEMGEGEFSIKQMEKMKEFIKDMSTLYMDAKKDRISTSTTTTT